MVLQYFLSGIIITIQTCHGYLSFQTTSSTYSPVHTWRKLCVYGM